MTWRRSILWLFVLLGLLAIPVLIELDETGPVRIMENLSIASSQETWLRQKGGESDAWLIPSLNGQPRIHKPPLLVWMNLLAWSDLDPASTDLEELVWRARLLGAGFALLALVGVFLSGRAVADARTGVMAVLTTGTMFLFIRQARFATYDIHLLGWLTLAVGCGLSALRATGAWTRAGDAVSVSRAAAWWTAAGAFMACAFMSKGPLAAVLGIGPLLTVTLLREGDRRTSIRGWLLFLFVAAALAAPWYVYILQSIAGSADRMVREYQALRNHFQPPWYYLGLIGLVFPWSLWLAAAARRVGGRAQGGSRWIDPAWGWFLFIFVFMSIPMAKQQRYIMPILPAAGLIVARLALAPWDDWRPWQRRLVRIHAWMLLAVSPGLPVLIWLQPLILARGWMDHEQLHGTPAWLPFVLLAALPAMAWAGVKAIRAGNPERAAGTTAAWMLVLATAAFHGYAKVPGRGDFPQQKECMAIHEQVGRVPVFYLTLGRPCDMAPSKDMLLYSRRIIPSLTPEQLTGMLASKSDFFLMVRDASQETFPTLPPGLVEVTRFHDGEKFRRRSAPWVLFRTAQNP